MMATGSPTIGFVGLGHMGGAMAARLVAAGHPVYGTNRTRQRAQPLLEAGLHWRDTARTVAQAAQVVFTSISDDDGLDAVASGPDGILAGLAPGTIWLDMSTVSPDASRAMAARVTTGGAAFLDAPVSGSVPQAQAGTLTIMVGGDENAYLRAEPLLRELGSPTHVGGNGEGLALKLAINISLAVQMLAFSEGLLLAQESGVDAKLALHVMTESPIASPMLKARAPLVLALPQDAWFGMGLMRKDIELALDEAGRLGIPLPTADRADDILKTARALGYDRRDIAAFYQVLERMTAQPR